MITPGAIRDAHARIADHIIRTPLVFSPTFSEMTGARVYLKLETLQKAGSFKVRGATNKILCNLKTSVTHGVVAASAGNHAQGVAVAAHRAGIAATIVMPEWASLAKQEATRGYGAKVIIHGQTLEESVGHAKKLSLQGMLFIHPYDDEEVIAGQGTIGIEILDDLPETDMIIVPVGGGGLIAGIATAVRAQRPAARIIGVQAEGCPSAYDALRSANPTCIPTRPSLADGIRVAQTGTLTLPVIRNLVEKIVIAGEDAIADAMLWLIERKKVVAEGAGAIPLAALLSGSVPVKAESTVVLVISGGNIDSPHLERTIHHALIRRGRIMRCSVVLDDQPGALARFLAAVAQEQGNILHIHHEQGAYDLPVHEVRVTIEIETRGKGHIGSLSRALEQAGYRIRLLSSGDGENSGPTSKKD
ncbi:MAG: threonine ammonia-lyase [Methanoregula sp.]|nr:MAG: threonine ammonia-lyase [Methanoregula sp.]